MPIVGTFTLSPKQQVRLLADDKGRYVWQGTDDKLLDLANVLSDPNRIHEWEGPIGVAALKRLKRLMPIGEIAFAIKPDGGGESIDFHRDERDHQRDEHGEGAEKAIEAAEAFIAEHFQTEEPSRHSKDTSIDRIAIDDTSTNCYNDGRRKSVTWTEWLKATGTPQ